MAEHTPTPWRLEFGAGDEWYFGHFGEFRVRAEGAGKFDMPVCVGSAQTDEQKADAAYIVRACNAFEALREAAQRVVDRHAHREAALRGYVYCRECYASGLTPGDVDHVDGCGFGRLAALLRQLEGGA